MGRTWPGPSREGTNNRIGAAGIAYRARIMPVRTLDVLGNGDAVSVSRGIRYAVRHHADVINLSLEFAPFVTASDLPDLVAAIRFARRRGVVVTAVAGNEASTVVPYPARAPGVIAVAGTTERGCHASYSNSGADVDVAAPGGGSDGVPGGDAWDLAHCRPGTPGGSIYQQTFNWSFTGFTLPSGYYGTSMAAPHVAGARGAPDRLEAAGAPSQPGSRRAAHRANRARRSGPPASTCTTDTA